MDNSVNIITETGSQIVSGVATVCYWGGIFIVDSVVGGFYGARSLILSRTMATDQDEVELDDMENDGFVIVASNDNTDDVINVAIYEN